MNEFEQVAADADKGLPARIGWLNRLHEEGRIKRYLFLVERLDDKGEPMVAIRYSDGEPLWALGAAHHIQAMVEEDWEELTVDD